MLASNPLQWTLVLPDRGGCGQIPSAGSAAARAALKLGWWSYDFDTARPTGLAACSGCNNI
jgi:hypothetical protein